MTRLYFKQGSQLEPQVVYAHRIAGETTIFHIGSGPFSRALSNARGTPWQSYVADRDVEVDVLEVHQCPARARLREAQLIAELQPETNKHHRNGPHAAVLKGHTKKGVRCNCGASDCYGREVELS
jgi:hypothetical protein